MSEGRRATALVMEEMTVEDVMRALEKTKTVVDAEVRRAEPEHCPVKFGVFGDPNKARADAGQVYCDWKIEQFARFVRELESNP